MAKCPYIIGALIDSYILFQFKSKIRWKTYFILYCLLKLDYNVKFNFGNHVKENFEEIIISSWVGSRGKFDLQ